MDKLLTELKDWLLAVTLSVAVFVAALLPAAALADGDMALDVGHGRGRGEGDPLDTNDADGGDISDDVHELAGTLDLGSGFFDRGMLSTRLLVIPEYHGTTLVFRVIRLAGTDLVIGETNAK